jgi:hypothetical protein
MMETTLTAPFPMIAMASWVAAILILARAWLRDSATARSTMDGPQLLLSIAVGMLPDRHREWGAAMSAELSQHRSPSSRWWFALGALGAAAREGFDEPPHPRTSGPNAADAREHVGRG